MPANLIEKVSASLEGSIQTNLSPGEIVDVQLKGRFKEALVCTDRRVLIVKSGFMTGNGFGSTVFQLPYSNIAGCEVKTSFVSGWFELNAGGMQNTPKKVWTTNPNESPERAPNCVSLLEKPMIARFRQAASYILERNHAGHRGAAPLAPSPPEDMTSALVRLWKLKCDGALSQAEYDTAKAKLIEAGVG
jgi:hypothetical protein